MVPATYPNIYCHPPITTNLRSHLPVLPYYLFPLLTQEIPRPCLPTQIHPPPHLSVSMPFCSHDKPTKHLISPKHLFELKLRNEKKMGNIRRLTLFSLLSFLLKKIGLCLCSFRKLFCTTSPLCVFSVILAKIIFYQVKPVF